MLYYQNKIKPEDIVLCKIQGNIFKESTYLKCSSDIFIRRFMNSNIAKLLDKKQYLQNSLNNEDVFLEIEKQYGKTERGKNKYPEKTLYWMGYIYRYWSILTNYPSKKIYKIINSSQLAKLYFPYHSMSSQQTIERILEQKEIDTSTQINEIDILKKIIN